MRLSELMKMEIRDSSGDAVGSVKDVRLRRGDSGWEIAALIVGTGAISQRLGFAHGEITRPVLLAAVMRWLGRHAWVVPWDDGLTIEGDIMIVDRRKADLPHPGGEG